MERPEDGVGWRCVGIRHITASRVVYRVMIRNDSVVERSVSRDRLERGNSEICRKRHVHIGVTLVELRWNWLCWIPIRNRYKFRTAIVNQPSFQFGNEMLMPNEKSYIMNHERHVHASS